MSTTYALSPARSFFLLRYLCLYLAYPSYEHQGLSTISPTFKFRAIKGIGVLYYILTFSRLLRQLKLLNGVRSSGCRWACELYECFSLMLDQPVQGTFVLNTLTLSPANLLGATTYCRRPGHQRNSDSESRMPCTTDRHVSRQEYTWFCFRTSYGLPVRSSSLILPFTHADRLAWDSRCA